jgi:ectoine hydroxylase-related dioxygenase (phytanoyl-CoA dioxygenase family)|tara:strand:- start:3365 stop:3853 length:489 start_codon:yes stop_codon:yes gene_type:complete
MRMDIPHCKFHNLDWHQDRSYYFQNRDGNKGLVCWIPLMNVNKKLGPLKIYEKSHKDGFIRNYKKSRKKNSSTQRKIKINKKYKLINKEAKEGDVIFLSKNTIHASGQNITNLLRFSLQVRIHDLMDIDYLSFRHKIIYNESDIKIMKNKGINISDIEKISV